MHNTYFDCYDEKYPNLIIEILDYFDISNNEVGDPNSKSVLEFCKLHGRADSTGISLVYQPVIIDRICKSLCDSNALACSRSDGGLGATNNYFFVSKDKALFWEDNLRLKHFYNSRVYGFSYIYNFFRDKVFPIVSQKDNGDYEMGTGFELMGGIVTAKHCIEDVNNIRIRGYSVEELSKSKIYVSENSGVDIAYIDVNRTEKNPVYCDDGEVLQEVLVLGYPKIPVFTDFLTAEKATISSIASARITPTKGNITAFGHEYLSKMDAMLITAKIRGGNSGGPVISSDGSIVGVACRLPNYEGEIGDYDDLGYGIAVPIHYLKEIINDKPEELTKKPDFFKNFDL